MRVPVPSKAVVAAGRALATILLALGLLQLLPSGPSGDRSWSSALEDALPPAESYAGDVAKVLSAWLSPGASVATWALREARTRPTTTPARPPCDGTAVVLLALGLALALCSPRHSAVGLRWARALRGPPSLARAR